MGKVVVVIGTAAVVLVACVVAIAVISVTRNDHGVGENGGAGGGLGSSTKAVHTVCSPTDYKETCLSSLAGAKSMDPKELLMTAFQATVVDLEAVIKNSTLYKQVELDERTKGALDVCEEVLNTSIEDLRRSLDKVGDIDVSELDDFNDYADDVKIWLSAAITNQDTCIDALENITGETGEKIEKVLKSSGEMLSNSLAMISDFSTIFASLRQRPISSSRRLLEEIDMSVSEIPSFIDIHARKLMAASLASLKRNVTVAKDGSGDFTTIKESVNEIPKKSKYKFVIFVKAGVYNETIIIPRHYNNVVLIGEGPTKTRISCNKSYAAGVSTFRTATLVVSGDNFMAKNIGIENTAGAIGHQAVAVRVSGDKAVFHNVHMDGYQDTLYAHTYRHFYRNCRISGTVDFIFGDAAAVLQHCRLVVRKPMPHQRCTVTAQGRKDRRSVGITVIHDCHITAEQDFLAASPLLRAYLGRPWKKYSRTIIMQSKIDRFIAAEGWLPWKGDFALDTLYYGEYGNRGNGSDLLKRVKWKGVRNMTLQLAKSFTAEKVFGDDEWVKKSGISYVGGLM